MLSFDGSGRHNLFRMAAGFLLIAFLASCQVRPLYDNSFSEKLSTISISAADDAVEQGVRNELVFLFQQGQAEPSAPAYELKLNVTSTNSNLVYDESLDANIAGRVTLTGTYSLVRLADNQTVGSGSKSVTALLDDLNQSFAGKRSILDAQKRAGRELAEFIKADIAAIMARQTP